MDTRMRRSCGGAKEEEPECVSPWGELTRTHTHTPQKAHTLQWALGTVSLTTRMGCNLCTLQKREEHYKLLYEIAQVSET